jgi:hypothetical protein
VFGSDDEDDAMGYDIYSGGERGLSSYKRSEDTEGEAITLAIVQCESPLCERLKLSDLSQFFLSRPCSVHGLLYRTADMELFKLRQGI